MYNVHFTQYNIMLWIKTLRQICKFANLKGKSYFIKKNVDNVVIFLFKFENL